MADNTKYLAALAEFAGNKKFTLALEGMRSLQEANGLAKGDSAHPLGLQGAGKELSFSSR